MQPESGVDTSGWTAFEWSEGNLERPAGSTSVRVTDAARWGDGFIAAGYEGQAQDGTADDGLIWLSTDGRDWRLVSDGSETFAGAELCCVTRARDAFIAWTRDSGVFLSSVDGESWTRTERQVDGYGLAVAETDDGLFALSRAQFDGTVFSTTNGVTWTQHATTGLHLATAFGFGRGGGNVLVSDVGYFVAGYAAEGGIHGVVADWGNWFSRDGIEWREIRFPEGNASTVGGNAGWFEEGHRHVYGHEFVNTGVFLGEDWVPPIWRTSDGTSWTEADAVGFPDSGRYDGHFTLDLSGLPDGTTRLSADGVSIDELATVGDAPSGDLSEYSAPAVIGPRGIAVFSGARVWFGRAVVASAAANRRSTVATSTWRCASIS
jgi:hypothetical protein